MSSKIGEYEGDKRIIVAQMCSGSDIQKNLETCERLVDQAISIGAKLICFPECFAFMGEKSGDSLAAADSLDGFNVQEILLTIRSSIFQISQIGNERYSFHFLPSKKS
jgi:predicted amidohydrolase